MKRLASTATAFALAASTALAQMGFYSFGIGPFNNATNSNYATTAGYYAGGGAKSDSRTTLFGSMAGLQSSYVQRSVGIGAGALYLASNCYDCVAIGDGAGAKWRNRSGWVQIGDAFAYTNGIADIKAPNGAKIGPLRLEADSAAGDHELKGNLSIKQEYNESQGTSLGGHLYAEADVSAPVGDFAEVQAEDILLRKSGNHVEIGIDDDMRIYVNTNGVLAGYLTITQPAQGGQ